MGTRGIRGARRDTKTYIDPFPSRGWKPDMGFWVRYRSKTGAESKTKCATYAEAKELASRTIWGMRDVWIEEAGHGVRPFRDLEPKKPTTADFDRAHVMELEEKD